jgi:hypothetical protein
MEFQQKGQQITLSQGVIFMKMGGELQWEKNAVELTFMVKAFTQNVGITVLMNFLLQKNVVFLYGPRPKLHLW